jgi:hypothetical protein
MMKYIKLFENFSFKEYIEEITTLCLVELEDDGYQVSVVPRMTSDGTTIENKCIVSIGQIEELTNLKDIEDYLMTYIDLIGSKSDMKISNIIAYLKDYPEGYNSNRVSINHIQKETLDFSGSYDNFFNYIRNKPMRSIMFIIDKI